MSKIQMTTPLVEMDGKHDAQNARSEILEGVGHISGEVHEPHRADESYRAEYPDRGKVLYDIQFGDVYRII